MGDQEIISMAPANEFIDANIVNEKKGIHPQGSVVVVAIAFQPELMMLLLLLILILLFTPSVSSICWNMVVHNTHTEADF